MADNLSDEEFLSIYQSSRLKENKNDPFNTALFKRRCMILSLAHSSKSLNNATACHIFEDQLTEYVNLIDDREGINNFAKATLELVSNAKNLSKSWQSGLPEDLSTITDIWDPPKGECVYQTSDGTCGNTIPPLTFLKQVKNMNTNTQLPSKATIQTTLDGFKKPSFNQGIGRKQSLFSSYPDYKNTKVQNSGLVGSSKPDNYDLKRRFEKKTYKNISNQFQAGSKVHTNSEEFRGNGKFVKQADEPWSNQENTLSLYSGQTDDEPIGKSGIYHQLPGGKGYYKNNKPLFSSVYGSSRDSTNNDEGPKNEEQYDMHFKTAGQELKIANQKKFGSSAGGGGNRCEGPSRSRGFDSRGRGGYGLNTGRGDYGYGDQERSSGFQPQAVVRKSLGGKRSVSSKFVPPVRNSSQEDEYRGKAEMPMDPESELDERLKNIEPRMIEMIKNEIMDNDSKLDWDDIAGLQFAKSTIQEIVVWPMLRPDIFTGLRRPPKGILLFGPPGTGKTLIGKCIASQAKATFFSISASSLTSKWIGDGEKMVRALFAVARCHQPAVVFIDEIDSLLSQRSETEHESSRRIKTEFLVQLDGAATGEDDRILVIGATNRPQELDEAARRRLVKRLYIPLPDKEARKQLVENLMKLEKNELSGKDFEEISCLTDGYSGADMKNLCQEACLGPIRSISSSDMFRINASQVRPVNIDDFKTALKRVKSSVSPLDLEIYLKWDEQYGSG